MYALALASLSCVLISGCNRECECVCECQNETQHSGLQNNQTTPINSKQGDLKSKNEIPESDKIKADSANIQGLELMKVGDYPAAYKQFVSAIEKNRDVPDYHNNAGLALMESGKVLDALVYFDETIGINPELHHSTVQEHRKTLLHSRLDKTY